MTTIPAAMRAAARLMCAIAIGVPFLATPAAANWDQPWKSEDRALVIDAYEFNPIDWNELTSDERIAGFINKASDGLPPEWDCSDTSGDDYKLCKNRWWKYSVTKELYMTRRQIAKMKGLLWGAYHLGRPGNPRAQADHFLNFAEPEDDELIALDIEDNSDEWMSLEDAEIFADQIKIRTGRYPVLYTNGSTAKYISDNKEKYPLLSRLPLWYARYRDDITGKFPEETWPTYALWQFSSMHNCGSQSCPYRVKGAKTDIDVNVASLDHAGLRKAWPFDELVEPEAPDASTLIASVSSETKKDVAAAATGTSAGEEPDDEGVAVASKKKTKVEDTLAVAYAPAEEHVGVDPLQLLTENARAEDGKNAGRSDAGEASAAGLSSEVADELAGHVTTLRRHIAIAAEEIDRFLFARPEREASVSPADDKKIRSRIVELMKAAEAAGRANSLAMPARVLSQMGPNGDERGDRVARVEKEERYAEHTEPEGRILSAFAATR